jgi:tetratricopeptide (TPR) repeat protein
MIIKKFQYKMKNSLLLFLVLMSNYSFCCSLIKITQDSKTIVANNEDNYFPNSKMSIEPAENCKYGVIYFGNDFDYIQKTKYSDFLPQGGINEAGLMFDFFSANSVICSDTIKKPAFTDNLIKEIMKNCSNVHQVKEIYEKYSTCDYGIAFFTDKNGDYLTIDNGRIILGNNKKFVQTNFHNWEKGNCGRYDTAWALIYKSYDYSVDFCLKVASATHQEWSMGGTQYTYIGDLDKGLIYLYYYHDFNSVKIFNIKEELKKGKRILYIPDLFPENLKGWENVNAFNHHRSLIEKLTDSLVVSNKVRLKEIEDSIAGIIYDKRFDGLYFYSMELFSWHLCKAGDFWFEKNNYDYASEIYAFTKKLYPFSWGSYNNLGYLYKELKVYNLALENFIICHGLYSNANLLPYIDSIKHQFPTADSANLMMCCGYFQTGKYYLAIDYKDGKYYVKTYLSNGSTESRIGESVIGKYIVMDNASIVFSDSNGSQYNQLIIYYNSERRGYVYKRTKSHK